MALSRRTGRNRFILPVLILVSITIITLDYRGVGFIDSARNTSIDVVSPVTDNLKKVFRPFTNVWNGVFRYDAVNKENQRLRAELDQTRGSTLAAVDAERQRQELLALLNLDYLGNVPTVAARVVSGAPSNFDATIEIDRGSNAGIEPGMPVVTGAGLVGNVVRVTGQRSIVRLLTDPSFAVGVSVPTADDDGVIKGKGPDRPLGLDLIDAQSKVGVGSVVITSGQEGSDYPAGIPVGVVRTVRHPAGALQLDITVDPAADLDHLDFVKVVQWEPGS
ncbi:MAG TPA: rod shape-determining protein MreC [Acidimicrobiales bacterium]|nr:rod shape-determining protein MreC [Acidimicrobiales bacterium]